MIDILNIIDKITNSDGVFYFIVIVLILICLVLFYLIYSQNEQTIQTVKKVNLNDLDEEEIKQEVTQDITEEVSISDTSVNLETSDELQSISKELETLPRDRKIELTKYEEEQEEKAIISYDELISKTGNVSIVYSDTVVNEDNDVLVKQFDLENTGKIELDPIKKELNSKVEVISYEHEEAFLKALKQLQSMLN